MDVVNVSSGIEQLLNSCLSFFHTIYYGGQRLFLFFSTPIEPTGDELIDVLLGSFIGYTPFELSFGVLLSSVLVMALVAFVKSIGSIT